MQNLTLIKENDSAHRTPAPKADVPALPYLSYETEDEAYARKSKMFDVALGSLNAQSMVFSVSNFVPYTAP